MATKLAVIVLCAWIAACAASASRPTLWNQGWEFRLGEAGFEPVTLPHTPRIEQPEAAGKHFQGVCAYQKRFAADPAWRGKQVEVRFDGAMQVAEVSLNGSPLARHEGGYLPFTVDLTPELRWDADNLLEVRLDNRDAPTVPPGKPLANLDFTYFGGLYRDVSLLVHEPLHIADGGVFVRTESLCASEAVVLAQAEVRNDGPVEAQAEVRFTILDPSGEAVASATLHAPPFTTRLRVASPKPWHPDHPFLYTLETELLREDRTLQLESTRFGIRTLACDDGLGFVLNGEPLWIRGANRHQDFPWLGNAVPDNTAWRDVKRLKDAGFNFLRLAHYPQSQAVMDACDELGLMVCVCTPGWQWWSDAPGFAELAKQNVREMLRWHRNHPCAVMWEVSLNETYGKDAFHAECSRIAREEYPGGRLLVSGDSYGSQDVGHYDVPYAGWSDWYMRPAAAGFEGRKRSFAREYGDYECGGEQSTTRVARGAGEERQLLQAWNFLWTHERNRGWSWLLGDAIWAGVDHFRGCGGENPISRCGVLDHLRLPKYAYYFFQSQRDPSQPSLFIANEWTPRASPAKVVVFSNCEEVELLVNGRSIARQKPDAGPDSDYGVWRPEADPLYMTKGKDVHDDAQASLESAKSRPPELLAMFDGGNCRNVEHPPFTFAPVPCAPGELRAIGYIGGRKACEFVRRTPGVASALRLRAETLGRDLAADGTDAVFVRAEVVDAAGEVVPAADLPVRFSVGGPGRMVSPGEMRAEAGIATLLLQATDQPGAIRIRARAAGLAGAELEIRSGTTSPGRNCRCPSPGR